MVFEKSRLGDNNPPAEAQPTAGKHVRNMPLFALAVAAVLAIAVVLLLRSWDAADSQKNYQTEKAVRLEGPGNGTAGALLQVTQPQGDLPYRYEVIEALKKEMVMNGSRFLVGRVVVRNQEDHAGNFTVRQSVSGPAGSETRETTDMLLPNQTLAFEFLFESQPANDSEFHYEVRAPLKMMYGNIARIVDVTGNGP